VTTPPPARYDITDLVPCWPYSFKVKLENEDGSAIDLTGCEVRAQVRGPDRALRGSFEVTFSAGPEDSELQLALTAAITDEIEVGDRWDLLVVNGGKRRYYLYGEIGEEVDGGGPPDLGQEVDGGGPGDEAGPTIDGGVLGEFTEERECYVEGLLG
jgi:hypothetical protein